MKIKPWLEKNCAKLSGAITLALYGFFGLPFFNLTKSENWEVGAIYSSIFDLSSLLVAFIFAFFTFARTSETDFIDKIRNGVTFKRFMNYLKVAMYATAAMTIASIPMMVAEPAPESWQDPWFYVCGLWAAFAAFSLTATARSVRQFIVMAMMEQR